MPYVKIRRPKSAGSSGSGATYEYFLGRTLSNGDVELLFQPMADADSLDNNLINEVLPLLNPAPPTE